MTKAQYTGVANVARKVKKRYVGIDNVARLVTKAYVGVANVARQYFLSSFVNQIRMSYYNNAHEQAGYGTSSYTISSDLIEANVTITQQDSTDKVSGTYFHFTMPVTAGDKVSITYTFYRSRSDYYAVTRGFDNTQTGDGNENSGDYHFYDGTPYMTSSGTRTRSHTFIINEGASELYIACHVGFYASPQTLKWTITNITINDEQMYPSVE